MGRREVRLQMSGLQNHLRLSVREGRLSPNEMLPSARELAAQFGLSPMSAVNALQLLVEEGVLRSVPRVGYFVGAQVKREAGTYLMLIPHPEFLKDAKNVQLQTGFEDRISKLGGSSMVLDWEKALDYKRRDNLPTLAGIFNLATNELLDEPQQERDRVASVWFGLQAPSHPGYDSVSFDDFLGGGQATRHLLGLGHKRIAFLGLHTPHDGATRLRDCEDEALMWSVERQEGWKTALREADIETNDDELNELYFHPHKTATAFSYESERAAALEGAMKLAESLEAQEITAVITVNAPAYHSLQQVFQNLQTSASERLAVVSFDDEQLVSSVRLPYHELGSAAADLLWERHHGTLRGASAHRSVPMRLIPRLSCRTDWNALALAS